MLYLYYTESKTHDYGKNIQRGAPPPPQLLRAGPRIARRRRTNRGNRTLRDQARTVGLQFAVHARRAAAARTPRGVVENREAHAAGDRSRRCVRTHRGEDRAQFRGGIRHGALLRGYERRPRLAAEISGLRRQFPRLVRTDLSHAPAGDMDDARRRRVRRVAATLQPTDRQRGAQTLESARRVEADSADAVRHSGGRAGRKDVQTAGRTHPGVQIRAFRPVSQ